MKKKSDAWVKVAIGLSALCAGIAFGHWARPAAPAVTKTRAPAVASLPSDSLTPKAVAPLSKPVAASASSPADHRAELGELAALLQETAGSNHLRRLTDFVDNLAPGDFGAALLSARSLPRSPDRDLTTRLLVARWAEIDPDRALAFASEHREFDQITGDVFQQLAGSDLSGTLARAQALTDPTLRAQALRGTLGVMAQTDPAGALRVAANAGDLPGGEPLSQMIYREWSQTDPASAAAAAALEANSGSRWRSPLGEVLRSWANEDPQAALNFALNTTDPSAQTRSVSDIVRRWSDRDASAAAGWINTVPAGPLRDSAAAALASAVASSDLPTAVGWAQSISDEGLRTSALQRVSRRVIWRDPANGPTTLQSAGVPPEILQNLPPPRER